jgi:hypothetical protein
LQAILDDVAQTDSRAKKMQPEDFIDRRFLDEMTKSGFFDKLWRKIVRVHPLNIARLNRVMALPLTASETSSPSLKRCCPRIHMIEQSSQSKFFV